MNSQELLRQASHSTAPADERIDARAEVQRLYAPTRSDLPPQSQVQDLVQTMMQTYQQEALLKAANSETANIFPNTNRPFAPPQPHEPKSILVDENGTFGAVPGGYKQRPSQFGAPHLRALVENTPLINAIILRRIRTVSRFLRPAESKRDVYFEVRKNDARGTVSPRKGPEETALEQFLIHSGWESNPVKMRKMKRDYLSAFMTKSIRDILTLDAWAIETVPTANGKMIDAYHAVDAGTIYLASEEGYMGDDEVMAVQIVNGMPMTHYRADELVYAVQNPRTDILHYGYGYAPPEMIIKIVTGYLNALTYNLKGFDSNAIPKGMLTLFGTYDEKQLAFFKTQWNSMVRGVNNQWSLPVMASETKEGGAQFTKFGVDFTDMYFSKWMVLLTSIVCSVYGMDPSEVYSESFSAGKSSLSGSDRAERMADSRDTGLEPLMTFFQDTLTNYILHRITPDYVLKFVGIQPGDADKAHEVDKLTLTANEMREKHGTEPTDQPWGEMPLNPALQQAAMAGQQPGEWAPGDASEEKPDDEDTDAQVIESGDRDGTKPKQIEAKKVDGGDRESREVGEPGKTVNNPEQEERDKDLSSMAHKSVDEEIVIVG
ncbi:MAG: phage portal protein [Nitrospirota bacterium]|nr:phage portal protein [Nitrospirota bacterium]